MESDLFKLIFVRLQSQVIIKFLHEAADELLHVLGSPAGRLQNLVVEGEWFDGVLEAALVCYKRQAEAAQATLSGNAHLWRSAHSCNEIRH